MPCNNGRGSFDDAWSDVADDRSGDALRRANEAMRAADTVTDMLCRLMRILPQERIETLDPDLQAWFAEHLKLDAEREKIERKSKISKKKVRK